MYFRTKKTRTTPVLQLVEGYRDRRGKVRQRTIYQKLNVEYKNLSVTKNIKS